jgi:hypothetical protein
MMEVEDVEYEMMDVEGFMPRSRMDLEDRR